MTYEVQQNRWDQLIRRASGSIGPGSRVSETLSELFPVLDVENTPGELLFLSGWRLGLASHVRAAAAGNNALMQIFNPVASGKLAVVTQVLISSDVAQIIEFDVTVTAIAATGNDRERDTRIGITELPSLQMQSINQPGSIAPVGQIFVEADVTFPLKDDNGLAVLAPGSGMVFSTTTQNSAMRTCFFWRERVAQDSELSF